MCHNRMPYLRALAAPDDNETAPPQATPPQPVDTGVAAQSTVASQRAEPAVR